MAARPIPQIPSENALDQSLHSLPCCLVTMQMYFEHSEYYVGCPDKLGTVWLVDVGGGS